MSEIKAKVVARQIPPQQGGLRIELVDAENNKYVAILSTVQLQTLAAIGESAPKVGNEVFIIPSEVVGRDGTVYCNINF